MMEQAVVQKICTIFMGNTVILNHYSRSTGSAIENELRCAHRILEHEVIVDQYANAVGFDFKPIEPLDITIDIHHLNMEGYCIDMKTDGTKMDAIVKYVYGLFAYDTRKEGNRFMIHAQRSVVDGRAFVLGRTLAALGHNVVNLEELEQEASHVYKTAELKECRVYDHIIYEEEKRILQMYKALTDRRMDLTNIHGIFHHVIDL